MVEEMIQAESGSMIATSVTGFELHEVDRTRGESKERSPDGELGKYSSLSVCITQTISLYLPSLRNTWCYLPVSDS